MFVNNLFQFLLFTHRSADLSMLPIGLQNYLCLQQISAIELLMREIFRPFQQEQTTLPPPSLRQWIYEDHQVNFLLALVGELDFSTILVPFMAKDAKSKKGCVLLTMKMMLFFVYCVNTVSSRKIDSACYELLACDVSNIMARTVEWVSFAAAVCASKQASKPPVSAK